jgi:protein involved in polysaccharide export with SLBB domain
MVAGSVYAPNAVTYRPGKTASWYLGQAGGPNQQANKRAIFVIRADGSIIGNGAPIGMRAFAGGLHTIALQPGDMVVVPEKAIGGPTPWQTIFSGAQAFSSLAFAANVLVQ